MSWYEDKVLPRLINLVCAAKPTRKQREKIVPRATGDVLEIGIGSGLNLPYYDRDKVRRIWGLEPSEGMRRLASAAIDKAALDVELIDLPGEEIPLDNNSVDTILVTYTLCTIPEVMIALDGMRRVLKSDGRLLFCEHGKAPDAGVSKWQERLNPTWKKFSGGCNMNRDIPALLTGSGFVIDDDNRMYIPGIRALSYNYWGSARIG
ncbi:MAG: class I SAM-dependent methyltransferase [Gammaproteobacteria bacterium]|nr:class I SAM-dependent methyltransferase [Gammaproteobacteria bacterium]MBU2676504.1 class I SAM-dependent methyltransferase [Gammaproteobacteria bacterium]NNC56189.1 class I SAM-dependent methyltransferase [Woeseiaceae bacterium]NNL50239.1 class I SAM-dependent methyltransferase [Woeseiaceae bacterium]